MKNFYCKNGSGQVERLEQIKSGVWIDLVAPDAAEVEEISRCCGIPRSFITDPLDMDERARIEVEDQTLLIVLRVPESSSDNAVPFRTIPLGIIYTPDYVVTVALRQPEVLRDFIYGEVKNFSSAHRERFILLLFYRTALLYMKYLKLISAISNQIETDLHQSVNNNELINLLNMEKSLVYFNTSLKANEIMIGRLATLKMFKVDTPEADLHEDVVIEYRQAIEMSNVYSNILSGTMDAFASIISNNLNVVMKQLTTVTIMLMLPTLVASIYGMNVKLPFQNSTFAFLITSIISIVLVCISIVIFLKRKWL